VKAGISKAVTAHTMRHTFGSHCAMRGVTWKQLQQWMGHSDVRTTIDTYCHVAPDYGHVEIDKIAPPRGPVNLGETLEKELKTPLSSY
jgi:integrase